MTSVDAQSARRRWADRLAAAAVPALRDSPLGFVMSADLPRPETGALAELVARWRDDAGHRRAADPWLLAHLIGGRDEAEAAALRGAAAWNSGAPPQPWGVLWAEVCGAADAAAGPMTQRVLAGEGPLFPEVHQQAIEVWTEGELTGLHALSVLARTQGPASAVHARVASAAQWLIAELQPDNATNRPWGVHVFAELAAGGDMLADLYAQTLLHNTMAGRLTPDRFSAAILLHSAMCLRS